MITCEICGGSITIISQGKVGMCLTCGVEYTKERLIELAKFKQEVYSKEDDFELFEEEAEIDSFKEITIRRYYGDASIIQVLDNVREFGEFHGEQQVFEYPEKVKQVILSEDLYSLGNRAFSGCSKLEELWIPKNVQALGYSIATGDNHTFDGCTNLRIVCFEQGGEWNNYEPLQSVFKGCKNLQKVELPNIHRIGPNMFEDCEQLEEIVIPDSVGVIYQDAFKGCRKLKKVVLPKHPIAIHPTAFVDTLYHPPIQYIQHTKWKRCPVCGGKLNIWNTCKKCQRVIVSDMWKM